MQESIRDLLVTDASAQPAVHIREVAGGGVCLAGAREQEVNSQADMAAVLEQVCCRAACLWILLCISPSVGQLLVAEHH